MKTHKKIHAVANKWVQVVAKDFDMVGKPYVLIFMELVRYYGLPHLETKRSGHDLVRRYLDEKHPDWHSPNLLPKKDRWAQEQKRARKAENIKKNAPKTKDVTSDEFLMTYEWRQLRMRVLVKRGPTCECCGANAQRDRVRMNVDHIKPRRHHPELALEESNLQILCDVCNHGKGTWDQTDWRQDQPEPLKPRLVRKVE